MKIQPGYSGGFREQEKDFEIFLGFIKGENPDPIGQWQRKPEPGLQQPELIRKKEAEG